MPESILVIAGRRVLICAPDGPMLCRECDSAAFMAEARAHQADVVVIPISRIDDAFFQLRTGVAGDIVQKFVNYRLPLIILGDISRWTARSQSLRDFVYEANRGNALWFSGNEAELRERITKSKAMPVERRE